MNAAKLVVFTILVPGFVAGYVPYSLYDSGEPLTLGPLRYLGIVLLTLGVVFYVLSALHFLLQGKGTPAIWFTNHLKFLIGEEPSHLVSGGLYKLSRNPMYVGVLSIVVGTGTFLQSPSILIYALVLGVFFHLVIVLLEEPHLKEKFGAEYERYLEKTNRWIGLPSRREKR